MSEIITVELDLAKNVFQVHGADGAERAVRRKKLRRAQMLEFFSQLPSCFVAIEACGGTHFWGRGTGKLGHDVRLIPPADMKPFVKRQKNDMADAEAICEADMRPTMCFGPVTSEETLLTLKNTAGSNGRGHGLSSSPEQTDRPRRAGPCLPMGADCARKPRSRPF